LGPVVGVGVGVLVVVAVGSDVVVIVDVGCGVVVDSVTVGDDPDEVHSYMPMT